MFKLFKKKREVVAKTETKVATPPTGSSAPATTPSPSARSYEAHRILLKPLVSEKTAHLGSFDTYGFAVAPGVNKVEIAKAFQAMYNVKPRAVRVTIMPEKIKRLGRLTGVRSEWKKALVRVPKGSKVDVFTGV